MNRRRRFVRQDINQRFARNALVLPESALRAYFGVMAKSNGTSQVKEIRKIIVASSAGTLIEWYDLFIYGSLATVVASQFYPQGNPAAALLAALATFAAGFIVHPFGAPVSRWLGGLIGRRNASLLTLIVMGGSTFAIGLIPNYQHIGMAAPALALLLRILQGLAWGGDYDAAAIHVAEQAPDHRRGLYTSCNQAMATLGVFLSLGVILLVRHGLDADPVRSVDKFNDWGWRIPFLVSIVLLAISIFIRRRMQESPLFQQSVSEDKLPENSRAAKGGPKAGLRIVLPALLGVTIGQGVVFFMGQFYVQSFLETVCKLDADQARTMLLPAILAAMPFFVLFGAWSDRVGRKWIMMAGMLLAALTYPFLFGQLLKTPGIEGRAELTGEKEIRSTIAFIGNTRDLIRSSSTISHYDGGLIQTETQKDTVFANGRAPGKPVVAVSRMVSGTDYWKMTGILFLMVFFVAMIYGPGGAFLAELFPPRIGYMPMSSPYHLGNGIFGGLTPFVATLLTVTNPGHPLAGLWYPVAVLVICTFAAIIYIPSKGGKPDADRA